MFEDLFDRLDLTGEPHEYVVCKECKRSFKTIEYSHLKHKHGIDIKKYENKYPDAERISSIALLKLGRIDEFNNRINDK